jgi:hypothetical protein
MRHRFNFLTFSSHNACHKFQLAAFYRSAVIEFLLERMCNNFNEFYKNKLLRVLEHSD